ncbi:energy transducer TonB [Flavicella marina]|uniref:energy transducer TonB n=1 Tax=Flavicella marina TaxID=1475951 RepID=UPI001264F0FF|nr:energy transducer TonB [Flavicella marina]
MKYLETKHERKSAAITVLLMAAILLLMLFFGMRYMDPPEEYGIAINFGTSDVGNGSPVFKETVKSTQQPTQQQSIPKQQAKPVEEVKEEVLTQNTEEAPVIQKEKVVKKETPTPQEKPKEIEKPAVKEAPKPSEATQAALSNLLNGNPSEGDETKGEGDDAEAGLKGSELGDPNSSKYYGNGGSGGDGNYRLGNRKAIEKPQIQSDCNEDGIVVINIEVDRRGNVNRVSLSLKGSNTTSPCLVEIAKKAALSTKWSADPEASPGQKGTIIYHFSLSE